MNTDRWSGLVLGLFILHMLAFQSDAAQSYTLQDLGVDDAMKVSGPNLSGQAGVRLESGTVGSSRINPGALPELTADSLGRLPGGDHTTANAINDPGTVVGSANGRTAVRPVIWTKN